MKKIFLLFILISTFATAQMPNVSSVWMNNSQPYNGTISSEKIPLRLKINTSDQNRKNDQEYFVSGFSIVENVNNKFEGNLTITKYKAGKKRSVVFGEYELAEENIGNHSGVFKGKFIYTFMWNKKTQKIERQFIEYIGKWNSYDGKLSYPTNWKN